MSMRSAEHLDPACERLEDRLAGIAQGLLSYVRERPDGWRLLSTEPPGEPAIASAYARLRQGTVDVAIRVTASDPDFTPPKGLSRAAAAAVFGRLQWASFEALAGWAGEHPEASMPALVRAFMDFAWIGLERFRTGEHWVSEA